MPNSNPPPYLTLFHSGELARRAEILRDNARACALCPRHCAVDRAAGQTGFCRAPLQAVVASHNVHMGEEPPITGTRGSGTIFFAHCTMRCKFCQNFPISQLGNGKMVSDETLADYFLELQRLGCHNINLVTPTHYAHAWLAALVIAIPQGFRLPIVYNTSGYEDIAVLRLLDGVIDIYLPDIKYDDPEKARAYSQAPDYIPHNRAALKEMHRQVGRLTFDEDDIATHGLLVRHLVLPGSEDESIVMLDFLQKEIDPECYVSLMSQYFPAHQAHTFPPLDKRIDPEAYDRVVEFMQSTDLQGWIQPLE